MSPELEHRLTVIETQMSAGFQRLEMRAKAIEIELSGVKQYTRERNGQTDKMIDRMDARVTSVERWKIQMLAVIGFLLAIGPITYLLMHDLLYR